MRKGALLLGLLILSTSFAKSYYYDSINQNITVMQNGDLKFIEQETLAFDGSFSYVYRYFYEPISNFRITGDIIRWERNGNEYKWYGSWVNTNKTFTIHYEVKDALNVTREKDILYITLVFWDRSVEVKNSINLITFPQNVNLNQTTMRINKGTITQIDEHTIMIKANNIPQWSALDFEIKIPKGMLQPPNNFKNFASTYPEAITAIILTPFIIYIFLVIKSLQNLIKEKKAKDKSRIAYKEIRIEEYKPAVAGLLTNYSASVKDVTATIIDLAIKGYIYIHKIVKKFWPDETILVKTKSNYSRLNDYEKLIMNTIFKTKKKVKFSELRKKFNPPGKLSIDTPLHKIKELMKEQVIKLELSDKKIGDLLISKAWKIIKPITISIGLLVIHILLAIIIQEHINHLIIPILVVTLIIKSIITMILASNSTKLINLTPKGMNAKQTYLNLKEYIKKQPLTDGRLFDTYLPYAISLGVQKHWIKKAQQLEKYETRQSTWHSDTITVATIASLTTTMNNSVSPASRGGAGGGGGGFGGGGGAGGGGGGAG